MKSIQKAKQKSNYPPPWITLPRREWISTSNWGELVVYLDRGSGCSVLYCLYKQHNACLWMFCFTYMQIFAHWLRWWSLAKLAWYPWKMSSTVFGLCLLPIEIVLEICLDCIHYPSICFSELQVLYKYVKYTGRPDNAYIRQISFLS